MRQKQREYIVKITCDPSDLALAEPLFIASYKWGSEYTPETTARMIWLRGRGLLTVMTCRESNPRAVYRNFYDPVYRDSCMEFFVTFNRRCGYLNFEVNSAGTALIGMGRGRGDRRRADELLDGIPEVSAGIRPGYWEVRIFLEESGIIKLFGSPAGGFSRGFEFHGNLYKCGDDTEIPHWGSWSEINTPAPDFHRPECFGRFILDY